MRKLDYCFIIVNYKIPEDTIAFIKSIFEIKDNNSLICVVDNDGSFFNYKNDYKNLFYIRTKENIDYLGGLKFGYEFIKKKRLNFDYYFFCNADLILQKNFFKTLSIVKKKKYECIAPFIINVNRTEGKKFQNPHLVYKPKLLYFIFMKIIYSNFLFYTIYNYLSKVKNKFINLNNHKINSFKKEYKIYSPYGSILGLDEKVISKINLDHKITSGGLELIISHELEKNNFNAYFVPTLKVLHKNKSSFSLMKKIYAFKRIKRSYNYIYEIFTNNKNYYLVRSGESGGIKYEIELLKNLKINCKNIFIKNLNLSTKKTQKFKEIIKYNLFALFLKKSNIFYPMGTFLFLKKTNNNYVIFHHKDNLNYNLYNIISHIYFLILILNKKKIKKIICVSRFWYNFLLNYGFKKEKLIIIYNTIDFNNSKISTNKEFYSKNNILNKRPFIYFGIFEKTNSLFINRMKEKYGNKFIFVFSSLKYKNYYKDNIYINYFENSDYYWILKNAHQILIYSKISEGWNRTAHESIYFNKNTYINKTGGMNELSQISKINTINKNFNFTNKFISHENFKYLNNFILKSNQISFDKISSILIQKKKINYKNEKNRKII